MDIVIDRNKINFTGENLMRRAGYGFIRDFQSGQESYVLRLTAEHYPRFHAYIKENTTELSVSLHLDQKKASYEGSARHSAEYEGETVQIEINRLKQLVLIMMKESKPQTAQNKFETKPWWQRLFGRK